MMTGHISSITQSIHRSNSSDLLILRNAILHAFKPTQHFCFVAGIKNHCHSAVPLTDARKNFSLPRSATSILRSIFPLQFAHSVAVVFNHIRCVVLFDHGPLAGQLCKNLQFFFHLCIQLQRACGLCLVQRCEAKPNNNFMLNQHCYFTVNY